MWLEAPAEESDDQGRTRRTTRNKDSKRGIPQGSPISPFLSNLYMRRLVLGWKRLGFERRFGARIVTYADNLVICCRYRADEALAALRQIAGRIGLTVNEEKTHVCRLPEGRFDFLGYSFERCYSEKTGRAVEPTADGVGKLLLPRPSQQALNAHARQRLRRWLQIKHKVNGNGKTRFPDQYLHGMLGLIYLPRLTRNLPWANA